MIYATFLPLFRVGAMEIILIVLLFVLLFGAKKIPELMRGMGRGVKEFKDAVNKDYSDDKEDESQGGEFVAAEAEMEKLKTTPGKAPAKKPAAKSANAGKAAASKPVAKSGGKAQAATGKPAAKAPAAKKPAAKAAKK